MRPLPGASAPQTIALNGDFTQWNTVAPAYYDAAYDTAARNYSACGSGTYTDNSGRNDLLSSKVAVDANNVYFWVQTAANITAHTGANWMQLLLDTDGNHTNGWNGYDFYRKQHGGEWHEYNAQAVLGRHDLERLLSTDREPDDAGHSAQRAGVDHRRDFADFHWVDNCAAGLGNDINNFWSTGDSAPDGHFNYRYTSGRADEWESDAGQSGL